MALNIAAPFKRAGAFPVDEALVMTKAEMLAINDNTMPAKYFCICSEDGQIYLYDKEATPSATTGKYKLFEGGGEGDKAFTYTQATPSATWTITHNLGKYPAVSIVDSAGSAVVGDVEYIDANTVTITFQSAFAGAAYFN